jgi:putative ABC transport system permease protein
MASAFRDEYRRAGDRRLRFWLDTFRDFSFAAIQEHWTMTFADLRVSMRRQFAQPGFTIVAILSLALGIGANTAIFSIVYASILNPLPFREAGRLVMLKGHVEGRDTGWTVYSADLVDWRERTNSFTQLEMVTGTDRVTVSGGGAFPERIGKQNVTPGYFPMLGVQPLRGRFFTDAEARSREPVALIGESYWQRHYGGDPAILGRTIAGNGAQYTIIGIVPSTYRAGLLSTGAELWLPIDLKPGSEWVQRKVPWIFAAGRLRDGVALETAQVELKGIARQLAQDYPVSNRNWTVTVQPLQEALNGPFREILVPLVAAAAFVLLIACLNVANLLLARGATRRRELAMRAALGASRERLLRELLADGVVLAVPGVLLGLGVAWAGIRIFLGLWGNFAFADQVTLNLPVLGFAAAAGVFTAIAAAVLPAWQASKTDVTEVLKQGGRGSAGVQRPWLRNGLVVMEIGLAVTLLMCAGLMLNTVRRLQASALGFDPGGIVTMRLDMSGERYAPSAPKRDIDMRYVEPAVNQFYEQLLEELRGNGWAKEAVLAAGLPMAPSGGASGSLRISGRTDETPLSALLNCVTEGYFSLLRIPVVKGRAIGAQDRAGTQWVAVINEALAVRYFGGEDPIGKYLTVATTEEEQPRMIVGVVANHKRFGQRLDTPPELYMSFAQQPRLIPGNNQGLRLRPSLAVRTGLEMKAVEEAVRKISMRLDASLPIYEVRMLEDHVADRSRLESIYLQLLGIFSGLALALAAVGVFGLMHYAVADRLQEIGIRIALGAQRKHVLSMVLSRGLVLTVCGLAAGAAGATAGTRLIERHLYGVGRADPVTGLGVAILMTGVALAACYIPARRATAVDPMVALRSE